MSILTVVVAFTQSNGDSPATGLILADIGLYLTAITKADGTRTVIWDGSQNPAFEVTNVGAYGRQYTNADLDTYDYVAGGLYSGAESLDQDYVSGAASEDHAGTWAYATRTLTQSAASIAAAIVGSDLTIKRGDSLSISLTGLGDISSRTKLWFTVKLNTTDPDTSAIIQIEETDGLIYLNAADASARAANGDITVDDASAGNITIVLDEAETDDLVVQSSLSYDIQMFDGLSISTLTEGVAVISADVTRAVS